MRTLRSFEGVLVAVAGFSMITAIGVYIYYFRRRPIGGPDNWAEFGDFFSGVVNPVVGVVTVILVVLTLRVTRKEANDTRQKMDEQIKLMRADQERQDVKRRLDGLLAEWNRVMGEPPDEMMLIDVQRKIPLPFEVICIRHMVETPEIHGFLSKQRAEFHIAHGQEASIILISWNALLTNVVPLVYEIDRCCDMHSQMTGNNHLSDFYRNRVVRAVCTLEVAGLVTPEFSYKFRSAKS